MKIVTKRLNTLRKFEADSHVKEYFKFYNVNHLGKQTTYQMNNKQMTEWENAQIRKTVNQVIHQMRTIHKTIEGVKHVRKSKTNNNKFRRTTKYTL